MTALGVEMWAFSPLFHGNRGAGLCDGKERGLVTTVSHVSSLTIASSDNSEKEKQTKLQWKNKSRTGT